MLHKKKTKHKLVAFITFVTFVVFAGMSFSATKTIATVLVNRRLDYCNSLYHNIALKDILKLQRVQNSLARVVTCLLVSLTQYYYLNHCIGSMSDTALL